ncbi:hypothetical protein RS82_03621 [Microbacterium trichothecenolyticum]|uniref:Uncharacterized protein n=1 Tax=Microbacterium trichothecenolyticum TaxID=69370 RepID=A0A0M2H880_MICTR|nr:hypothetical protein RS82_03621 [Microbacterium trichothecenolyticum]
MLWVRGVGTIAVTVICAQSGAAGSCIPMRTQVAHVLAARSRNTPPGEAMTRRAPCRTDRARAAQIGRGLAVMEVRAAWYEPLHSAASWPEPRRPPGAAGRSCDPRPLKVSCHLAGVRPDRGSVFLSSSRWVGCARRWSCAESLRVWCSATPTPTRCQRVPSRRSPGKPTGLCRQLAGVGCLAGPHPDFRVYGSATPRTRCSPPVSQPRTTAPHVPFHVKRGAERVVDDAALHGSVTFVRASSCRSVRHQPAHTRGEPRHGPPSHGLVSLGGRSCRGARPVHADDGSSEQLP